MIFNKSTARTWALLVAVLAMPSLASAANAPVTEVSQLGEVMIDKMLQSIDSRTGHLATVALQLATGLAVIDLIWSFIRWGWGQVQDVSQLFHQLFAKLLVIGFIAVSINGVPTGGGSTAPLPAAISSSIASIVGGPGALSLEPGEVFKQGISLGAQVTMSSVDVARALSPRTNSDPATPAPAEEATSWFGKLVDSVGDTLSGVAGAIVGAADYMLSAFVWLLMTCLLILVSLPSGLIVVYAYGIAAVELLMTQLEVTIVGSLGLFFLAGGVSRWTAPYARSAWSYAVSSGVKLGLLALLVAAMHDALTSAVDVLLTWAMSIQYQPAARTGFDVESTSGVLAAMLSAMYGYACLAMVALMASTVLTRIPAAASAALNGSPMMGGAETAGAAAGTLDAGGGAGRSAGAAIDTTAASMAKPAGALGGAATNVAGKGLSLVKSLGGGSGGGGGGPGGGGGGSMGIGGMSKSLGGAEAAPKPPTGGAGGAAASLVGGAASAASAAAAGADSAPGLAGAASQAAAGVVDASGGGKSASEAAGATGASSSPSAAVSGAAGVTAVGASGSSGQSGSGAAGVGTTGAAGAGGQGSKGEAGAGSAGASGSAGSAGPGAGGAAGGVSSPSADKAAGKDSAPTAPEQQKGGWQAAVNSLGDSAQGMTSNLQRLAGAGGGGAVSGDAAPRLPDLDD